MKLYTKELDAKILPPFCALARMNPKYIIKMNRYDVAADDIKLAPHPKSS